MSINFEIGNSQSPKGHAILYFGSLASGFSATYVVLLPIKMDMSKYLPPLMAAQLGSEANDLAYRMAKNYTNSSDVLVISVTAFPIRALIIARVVPHVEFPITAIDAFSILCGFIFLFLFCFQYP